MRIQPITLIALAFGGYACGNAATTIAEALDAGDAREAGAPREASAQVPPPDAGEDAGPTTETATEPCSHNDGTHSYAEHAYPGRTATDLANVRAIGHIVRFPPLANYQQVAINAYVRDGYAATTCGTMATVEFDSVTFSFTAP